jgi:hypothetical protein
LRDALERGALPRARTTLIALVAAAAALLALIATPAADAKPGKAKNAVPFSVMTRNIFLGADLSPALNSTSAGEFIAANGAILREVDATNFPLRAQGLAKEIKSKKPDLVGIQEGAWWRTGDTPGPPVQGDSDAFTAVTTRQDFLQLLLDQLNSKTNKKFKGYRLAVVGTEFDFEAPADYDNNPSTGLLGGEIQGRLTMRDAILVRKGGAVKANNPQTGHFSSLFTPTISGIQVPVTRGWVSLDASAKRGKGKDVIRKKFHFVNSHFEAFDDETQHPSIRAQQAAELASGPASNPKSIILGDFNSDVPGLKPGDEQAYQVLLDAGFTERATDERTSCCVPNLFTSPPSEFDHRVDHVMTNMGKRVKLVKSEITGKEQVNGIYDSDHAGVFSRLKIK